MPHARPDALHWEFHPHPPGWFPHLHSRLRPSSAIRVPKAKRPVEAEGSTHLLTLKVNEGVCLFAPDEILHPAIDQLVRIVDFSGLRLIGFTFVGNHLHINLRIPAGSRDTPAIDELMRRLDRLYGAGRNPPARGRYEIDIATAFANGSEPFVMHRMGRRSEFAKTLAETFAREFRKDATQPGHLWCGVYHTTELAGPGALRRVAVYIDSNRSAAHIDRCPGDSIADSFGRAVAGDKDFQQNYCALHGVATWPEARRLHSLALADYGSRRHVHKRPLDLDALDRLRNDRVRPCAPGSGPVPNPIPAGYKGCINLLRIARSVRVHDPVDESALRSANRNFDCGKRSSLPFCDLVGFRQTRESKYDPKAIDDPFDTPPPTPGATPTKSPQAPTTPTPPASPPVAPVRPTALTAKLSTKPTHGPEALALRLRALRDGRHSSNHPAALQAPSPRRTAARKSAGPTPTSRAKSIHATTDSATHCARHSRAKTPATKTTPKGTARATKSRPGKATPTGVRRSIREPQHRPTPTRQLSLAADRILARREFTLPAKPTPRPSKPRTVDPSRRRHERAVTPPTSAHPSFGIANHTKHATGPPLPKAA